MKPASTNKMVARNVQWVPIRKQSCRCSHGGLRCLIQIFAAVAVRNVFRQLFLNALRGVDPGPRWLEDSERHKSMSSHRNWGSVSILSRETKKVDPRRVGLVYCPTPARSKVRCLEDFLTAGRSLFVPEICCGFYMFLLHDFSLREMVTRDASVETSGANATMLSPPKFWPKRRSSEQRRLCPSWQLRVREIAAWGFSTNPTPLILTIIAGKYP